MKLSRKLIFAFVTLIILSIMVISIISNIMINNRFENYLISEREEKFQRIYYEINQLYIDNNYKLDPMELIHYALAEDINIIIKDTSNKIIYNSNTRRSMGMMGGMHHGHMGHMGYMHRPEGKYIEKEYPLTF
ncbi:MAG TPA: sensor histidine kinase, partial [Tissierellaceae bacterium]|nr:sensor histidine kinase [Tissierellaceae bacterium]